MTDIVQLAPGVRLSAMDTSMRDATYMAQMPDGRQLHLSKQLYHLLRCMDNPRSLAALADDFCQQTGKALREDDLVHLIDQVLRPQGLLAGEQSPSETPSSRPASVLALHFRRDLVRARYLYPITRVLHAFFALPLVVVLLPLVIVAHGVTYLTLGLPPRLDAASVPLFWVYALFIVSALLHELGHLSACQRWQCAHGPLGVGFYFFSPVFYVDVSPAWQLSRWKRAIVDVGGIYFELLLTIALCTMFWVTGQVVFLWGIILVDMSILSGLNPLIKLDGYWLLSDLSGMPNLHKRASDAIRYIVASFLYRLGVRKQHPVLNSFWRARRLSRVSVLVYAVVSVVLWPLFLGLMIPTLVQALVGYPTLWRQSFLSLIDALRTPDISIIAKELGRLLFPILILANLGVLVARPLASRKIIVRRITMSDKTKWILIGSGVGAVVAMLAIGLTLLIVRPNLQEEDIGGLPVGQTAPDFIATDVNGDTVQLSDFRGQPVLLKFWSPECSPCVNEVPDFKEAYESLGGEVVFLTIAADTPVSTTKSFVAEQQIEYPVLLDEDKQLMTEYRIIRIPFVYFIDPAGVIQRTILGTQSLDELEREIAACGSKCGIQLP